MIGRIYVGPALRSKHLCRRWRAVAFLFDATFAFSTQLHGTSIVALVDPAGQRVVVAADCRVNSQAGPVFDCKILQEPDCIAAIAGLYEERSTGFHLRALVQDACRAPGDLRAKAEAFLGISRKPFERAIRAIRNQQPAEYASTIANKPTEVIFAGIQNGQVGLIVRGLTANSDGKIAAERLETTAPTYRRLGYFVGLNGHIRAYITAHPDWLRDNYSELAPKLAELEIRAHPEAAALPVSAVPLDNRGVVVWLSKGACEVRQAD